MSECIGKGCTHPSHNDAHALDELFPGSAPKPSPQTFKGSDGRRYVVAPDGSWRRIDKLTDGNRKWIGLPQRQGIGEDQ